MTKARIRMSNAPTTVNCGSLLKMAGIRKAIGSLKGKSQSYCNVGEGGTKGANRESEAGSQKPEVRSGHANASNQSRDREGAGFGALNLYIMFPTLRGKAAAGQQAPP